MAKIGAVATLSAAAIFTCMMTMGVEQTSACSSGTPQPDTRYDNQSDTIFLESEEDYACISFEELLNDDNPIERWEKNGSISYYLSSHLRVETGVTLEIDGKTVETLYLKSDDKKFVSLTTYGGNLKFTNTHVFSWDVSSEGYDEDLGNGRSYIAAISRDAKYACDGKGDTYGKARMDVSGSEIAYLGWDNTESYGLSWKARGLCGNSSNLSMFDNIGVEGDITGSNLHHNYFGMYSYGHDGGRWTENEVHDNIGYGFDPHDDSDFLIIRNNHVYNNGNHGIIASKRCDHVEIAENDVHDNGGHGIMLHRSCNDGVIRDNLIYNNEDAGISIHETSRTSITENKLTDNLYGVRFSVGSSYNIFIKNEVLANEREGAAAYAVYSMLGSDEAEVGDNVPRWNEIEGNKMSGTVSKLLAIHDSEGTVIEDNESFGTGQYFDFRDSTSTNVSMNTFSETEEDDEGDHYRISRSCFDKALGATGEQLDVEMC